MTDLLTKVRTTYQAPITGSRIRYRKADAYADWAYAPCVPYVLCMRLQLNVCVGKHLA